MAITFKSVLASGGSGSGAVITVTYSAEFYNQTLTATNGTDTVTALATSAGTVDITVPSAGSWVVSCTISGTQYIANPVVVDLSYETVLTSIPDGKTVLPVNDIQTWLECAGIKDKAYTTLSEVLADEDTFINLIADSNAVDYMVRCHDWCDDVCSDANAMRLIGMYDYCADTLLADDNPNLVPTMTSDTTPSGTCISNGADSGRQAYKAFDGSDTTFHSIAGTISAYYLGYTFPSAKIVKSASILADSYNASYYYDVAIYAGDSISNLTKISDTVMIQANQGVGTRKTFTIIGDTSYSMYVLKIEDSNASSTNGNNWALFVYDIKLFGNDYTNSWLEAICNSTYFESVLNVKVPTMTSNTTPSGEAFANASYTAAQYYPWKAFNSGEVQGWMPDNISPYIHANNYIGYAFTSAVKIYMSAVTLLYYSGTGQISGKFQASSDGVADYKDITDIAIATMSSANTPTKVITNQNLDAYSHYRYICTTQPNSANHYGLRIQFYGRKPAKTDIIHSAPADTIYYMDNGTPTTLCVTDVNGVGSVDWSDLPTGDITIYSSVAKNPSDLSADYGKTIKVTQNKTEAYLMPNDTLYWFGYADSRLETCNTANGWTANSGYSLVNPTYDTFGITMTTTSVQTCGVGTTQVIPNPHTMSIIAEGITGNSSTGYGFIMDNPSKVFTWNSETKVTSYSIAKCSRVISASNYYGMVFAHYGRAMKVYAIWLE